MPQPTPDLTGQRFGRLEVIERDRSLKSHAYWRCRCDCGAEPSVASTLLRNGHTRSCGCLRHEVLVARITKHGMTAGGVRTPSYNSWSNMMRRCTNPADPRYPDWGGRGITVCERWHDYTAFLADMGEKPLGTTLDRINNDGPYCPENCRWSTPARQQRNTRRFKLTTTVVLEIQRLYAQGLGIGVIAEQVGVRRHTVGTACIVLDALAGT